jgi:peptidoglycan/LPS O-acetylase OafA/YrhL
MSYKIDKYPLVFKIMSLVAIIFGLVTIKSGGMVLFTQGEAHQAAGDYVPFVLWFNFLAGFAYLAAGIGLWMQRSWAALSAIVIAVFTVLVFIALGVYIYSAGAYEMRTVAAMSMRSIIWMGIALITYMISRPRSGPTE